MPGIDHDPTSPWRRRGWWPAVERRVLRLAPPLSIIAAVERLAPVYGSAALDSRWLPLPRGIDRFVRLVETLRGEEFTTSERRRFAGRRLSFLLTRSVVHSVLEAWPAPEVRTRLPRIDIEGRHHLDVALAQGRGAVLASAHLGLPLLLRPALDGLDIRMVAVGYSGAGADESVAGTVWQRTRALRRVQEQLGGRRVCAFYVDSGNGRGIKVSVLAKEMTIGLGAFVVAQQAGCPVLPAFALSRPDTGTFVIEFGAPLALSPGPGLPLDTVREFGRLYEGYVRRYPDQLRGYQPLFLRRRRTRA